MEKYKLVYFSAKAGAEDGIFKTKDVLLTHDSLNCLLKDGTKFFVFSDTNLKTFIVRRDNIIELAEI